MACSPSEGGGVRPQRACTGFLEDSAAHKHPYSTIFDGIG
jgi:hypothetical protein